MPKAASGQPLRPAARQLLLQYDKVWVNDSPATPVSAADATELTVATLKELLPSAERGSADVWADRESSGQLLRALFIALFENGYRDLGLIVETAEGPRQLPFVAVANQPLGRDVKVRLHQRRVEVNNPTTARPTAVDDAAKLGLLEGFEAGASRSYDVDAFTDAARLLFTAEGKPQERVASDVTVLFSKDTSTETVATVLSMLHQARSSVSDGTRRAITFSIPQKRRERVKIDSPKVDGRLSAEVIAERLGTHRAKLEECYERGLANNAELRGTVRIRLVIGRTDIAATSTPSGEFADAEVSKCLARALYGASFPAPEGGNVTVEVPLELSP